MSTSIFDFVRTRLDILDIVSRRVQLKRMGNYFKGPCPFHNERDASFTVSPDRGIFYCFGCHESGDAVAFTAKIDDLSQMEALELLIEHYNIDIPSEIRQSWHQSPDYKAQSSKHFAICKEVALWAHNTLKQTEYALNYVQQRGITAESIERFCLGLFPSSINPIVKAMSQKGILTDDLVSVGILATADGRLYSPFQDRIIFPIRDHVGRFIAFGGRIFKPDDTRPKYYNSKESEQFQKGHILYGQDLAKEHQKTDKIAFLVEGYLDCISMAQGGFPNTVATLGTAATKHHLASLSRVVEKLYVMYDGDNAGQKAMLRLAELCWQTNIELLVVTLPGSSDPNSFLKAGGDLAPLVKAAPQLLEFFIQTKGKEFSSATLQGKIKLSREIIEVIARLTDPLKQNVLLQLTAQQLQLPLQPLKKLCRDCMLKEQGTATNEPTTTEQKAKAEEDSLEAQLFLISLVGAYQAKEASIRAGFTINRLFLEEFPEELRNMLNSALECQIYQATDAEFEQFLASRTTSERDWIAQGMLKYESRASLDHFNHAISVLAARRWKTLVHDARQKIRQAQRQQDQATVTQLLNDIEQLSQQLHTAGQPMGVTESQKGNLRDE